MLNLYIGLQVGFKKQYDQDTGKSSIFDVKLPTSITWKVTKISLLTSWNSHPTWRLFVWLSFLIGNPRPIPWNDSVEALCCESLYQELSIPQRLTNTKYTPY